MVKRKIINEFGREVVVGIEVRDDGLITILIEGPDSTGEQTMTRREAIAISQLLNGQIGIHERMQLTWENVD